MRGFWLLEVRQLDQSGHQVWMLSSDYKRQLKRGGGVALFARWCRENFFQ